MSCILKEKYSASHDIFRFSNRKVLFFMSLRRVIKRQLWNTEDRHTCRPDCPAQLRRQDSFHPSVKVNWNVLQVYFKSFNDSRYCWFDFWRRLYDKTEDDYWRTHKLTFRIDQSPWWFLNSSKINETGELVTRFVWLDLRTEARPLSHVCCTTVFCTEHRRHGYEGNNAPSTSS